MHYTTLFKRAGQMLAAGSLLTASAVGLIASAPAGAGPTPTVPSAPLNTSFYGGKSLIAAYWDAPASIGGSAISFYRLCVTSPSASCQYVPGTTHSATLKGLTNGTSYSVSVEAINAQGVGTAATGTKTPGVIPSLTTGVYVLQKPVVVAPSTTTVQWNAPSSDGGYPISTYNVRQTDELPSGYDTTNVVAPVGSAPWTSNFTGQTDDQQYKALISATNGQGTSLNSAVVYYDLNHSFVAGSNLVKNFQVRVGDNYITGAWAKQATTGGSTTLGYDMIIKDGITDAQVGSLCQTNFADANGSWCNVSGLPTGHTYKVGVRARTVSGDMPWSYDSVATTFPTSATPVNVSSDQVVNNSGVATGLVISWDPGADGYDQVQNYTVCIPNVASGCQTVPRTTHTVTFTGLAGGTSYPVSIFPTNISGATAKYTAAFGNPPGQPGAPHLTQHAGGGATVSWNAPSSSGSDAIDGYKVTLTDGTNGAGVTACTTSGALTCSMSGLTDGTTYEAVISAHNSYGYSLPQAVLTWTQNGNTVGAPLGLYVNAGSKYLTMQWKNLNVPVGKTLLHTKATLVNTVDGSTSSCQASTATSGVGTSYYCTVAALTNGTSYSVTIQNTFTDTTKSTVSPPVIGVPFKSIQTPHWLTASRNIAGDTLNVNFLPGTSYVDRGPSFIVSAGYSACVNDGVTTTCQDLSSSSLGTSFTVDPGSNYTVTVTSKSDGTAVAKTWSVSNAPG